MLKLDLKDLKEREKWSAAGIAVPSFDIEKMREETKLRPRWAHIGPGNIFRGFIAELAQELIEAGDMQSGVTVVSTFDQQVISKIYEPYDSLALRVAMRPDGRLEKEVVASVGEVLRADGDYPAEWARAKEIFADPGLQMVSFTITEKGYHIKGISGEYYPDVLDDFRSGASGAAPKNGMAAVAALLLERYKAGAHPIALVSMDNFSHNGDKLLDSVSAFAKEWCANGTAPDGFFGYVSDPKKVSFPWSMIDKITPRPDASVSKTLNELGFESTELVITDKNTYIAPFVNTEGPQYLVIEDSFHNGRPPLEKAGVRFTERATVDLVERMKVCTCLNPLHTAMAVFGCLLGYTSIAAEMKDESIVRLIKRIGYVEGMPVVADPKIFVPADFIAEVIGERLPNPYIPDTPQRIATDTSQKLPIRYGETIKHYMERPDLDVNSLRAIPLVIAAWCRYLLALDDEGRPMELSPDPLAGELREYLGEVRFGDPDSVGESLRPILSSERIFGTDLFRAGLADSVAGYFKRMIAGPRAVRQTLDAETAAMKQ